MTSFRGNNHTTPQRACIAEDRVERQKLEEEGKGIPFVQSHSLHQRFAYLSIARNIPDIYNDC